MGFDFLLPLLAMFTLLFFLCFAIYSKTKTEQRKKDDSVPPSSLARDGGDHDKAP